MEQSIYIILVAEKDTLMLVDYQRQMNDYIKSIATYRKLFADGKVKGYVGVKVTLVREPGDYFGEAEVLHCEGAPPNKVLEINKQAKKAYDY